MRRTFAVAAIAALTLSACSGLRDALSAHTDWVARAGSADTREIKPGTLPPREQAQAILNAYLEALKFSNGRVNGSYLSSLGLVAP